MSYSDPPAADLAPETASLSSSVAASGLEQSSYASDFIHFSEVGEAIAATTKRLEKASLLAAYFDTLEDADLSLAARYFAGYTFSLRDQRTINIGSAALRNALRSVSGCDETWMNERLVIRGDFGDVAYEAWLNNPQLSARLSGLTLTEIKTAFETLAETSGNAAKLAVIVGVLEHASSLEAKYAVKLLSGELRIGLLEGAVEDALARWAGVSVGEIQWSNMLTGDIGETALLARHKRLGEAKMRLFHPLKFMLATPAADLADVTRQMPGEFIVEDKYDGIRAQAHIGLVTSGSGLALHGRVVAGRRVALFSRTLDEITGSFPDLLEPLAQLLPETSATEDEQGLILDGEILPYGSDGILPFQALQQRLGRKVPTEEVMQQIPVAFIIYDALYADGIVLLEKPLLERRAVIDSLPTPPEARARPAASRHFSDAKLLDAEFDAARARGNEGLMVKNPASPYKPGKRGRDWLKIKRALATLDVVITAAEVGSGRRSRFLSDYTFAVRASADDPTLLNVGKAYSGLTDAEIQELSVWLTEHTTQTFAHGKVRIVEPKIVLEVTFDRVQPSSRHKSGYALRFPRIVRIRHDKPADEADTLEAVKRLVDAVDLPKVTSANE